MNRGGPAIAAWNGIHRCALVLSGHSGGVSEGWSRPRCPAPSVDLSDGRVRTQARHSAFDCLLQTSQICHSNCQTTSRCSFSCQGKVHAERQPYISRLHPPEASDNTECFTFRLSPAPDSKHVLRRKRDGLSISSTLSPRGWQSDAVNMLTIVNHVLRRKTSVSCSEAVAESRRVPRNSIATSFLRSTSEKKDGKFDLASLTPPPLDVIPS